MVVTVWEVKSFASPVPDEIKMTVIREGGTRNITTTSTWKVELTSK